MQLVLSLSLSLHQFSSLIPYFPRLYILRTIETEDDEKGYLNLICIFKYWIQITCLFIHKPHAFDGL